METDYTSVYNNLKSRVSKFAMAPQSSRVSWIPSFRLSHKSPYVYIGIFLVVTIAIMAWSPRFLKVPVIVDGFEEQVVSYTRAIILIIMVSGALSAGAFFLLRKFIRS